MKSEFSIGRKAFSLLELLVSITLLALVSALIYGAFFQVSNSSLKVKESLSQSQELRLLMKMVLDDLQSCLLYTSPSPRDGLLSRMPSSA